MIMTEHYMWPGNNYSQCSLLHYQPFSSLRQLSVPTTSVILSVDTATEHSNNSQKRIIACWRLLSLSVLLPPVPHIHSTLWGALEGCDLCGQTSLSSLTTTLAAVPVRLHAILKAACPKKGNNKIKTRQVQQSKCPSIHSFCIYPSYSQPTVHSKWWFGGKFTLERPSTVSFRAVSWFATATPSISASTSALRSTSVSLCWPLESDL